MFYIILAVHLVLCLMLVGLVLLQQGKGADMGAAFGSGASNTLFGAGGATSLILKVTTGVAVAFMATSILLIKTYGGAGGGMAERVADPLAGSVMKDAVQGAQAPASPAKEEAGPPSAAAQTVAGQTGSGAGNGTGETDAGASGKQVSAVQPQSGKKEVSAEPVPNKAPAEPAQ